MPVVKRLISWLDRPSPLGNLAIMAITALLLLVTVGYFRMDLSAPANITGDHLFFLTLAKSYINGHGFRFDSQLGYPGARDWLYFPSFDLSYRVLLWLGARVTSNPFVVIHLVYIVCFVAMACSYYWTLRRLGVAAWISVIGALASIVTPYLQGRSFGHDALALSFSVPFGFGLAMVIGQTARTGSLKGFLRDPYVLTALVVVGISGLYYAFFTVIGALFVGVATGIGDRRLFPVLAAGVVTVVVFALLLFSGYGLDLPVVLSGRLSQPHRQAFEQLLYGFDFESSAAQLRFLPYVSERFQTAYDNMRQAFNGETGEWPGLPLTLAILASPLVLAIAQSAAPTAKGESVPKLRLVMLCGSLMLFFMLYSVRGGIAFSFNLLVTAEIRATERIMPFLTFGAALLICLGAELARDSDHRWVRYVGASLAALLLVGAMPKYVQGAAKWQSAYLKQPAIIELQKDTRAMLRAKDKARLNAVLELPVMPWPEVEPPTPDFNPYEMQLPYIYDRPGSTTHWSYGVNERQAIYTQLNFQTNHVDGLPERARKMGFDGILVEKKAFKSDDLAKVQAGLAAQLPPACRLFEDEDSALYALPRTAGGSC